MKFVLGAPVRCDLQKLVDTRALIQANSGGGKSHTLRRLLEQTHGHVQQLVVDPEGEFATLRERFDYVYAAPGGFGDTVAHPRSAKLLAERLLELGVSAILDIYELKAHERIRFVRGFLEALIDAPKRLWHPVLVVLDEAHVYCPQKGEAESAGAVIDLCTRGRKRGFCPVLATQRLSKLHKDAAAELNNKLIGRTGLDVDMKRAGEELGFTSREDLVRLRQLAPGEFFAFGPALSAAVVRLTVGPVQTTHPKAGARIAFTPPPPTDKVRALLPKLADLPAEAEERQRTTDELRRELAGARVELARLKREAPAAPARTIEKVKTVRERVEVPVITEAAVARLERAIGRLHELAERAQQLATPAYELARDLRQALAPRPGIGGPVRAAVVAEPGRSRQEVVTGPPARPVQTSAIPESGEAISTSQQRILDALAWLDSVGVAPGAKEQLAFLADQRPTSGGYFNNLGRLRTLGLITYPQPGTVALSDSGRARATPIDHPPTTEQLHRLVRAKLSRSQWAILEALIAQYPEPIGKDELAERANQRATSGGYFNNLGRLRSLRLIDYPRPGQVVALPVLFLEGAQ